MMKKAVKLTLTGAMQGIFFKNFMKENAQKFNVTGFVRKLEDGRMEIFIEGDREKVDAMSSICKEGPPHSQIRNVEEKEEKFQGVFSEFKVFSF
ncbi:MAG: acylphosphatase [Nanoarchaeota archaeon]|nr:acylphosphatase [Nanoarchaeota archaeon]